MNDFIKTLEQMICDRRKMTSPLYQLIMDGKASQKLLQEFVINRWPIKNFWTRNILGIASRIDDYELRCGLITNIYEEETGALTNSCRHLQSFVDFGEQVGVSKETIENAPILPETRAVIEHNLHVCNDSTVHFSAGIASVLLLMEGQPPIINAQGQSMQKVMRDVYQLPHKGYDFFTHHASSEGDQEHISELEDDHASTAKEILRLYCTTPKLQQQAVDYLAKAIDLRHLHFDVILERYYNPTEPPFRWPVWQEKELVSQR